MPKITIREEDYTSNIQYEPLKNVVYIPGFATAKINPLAAYNDFNYVTNDVTGVPVGIPKLCTSITEFKKYFGSEAPTFAIDQHFPIANIQAEGTNHSAGFHRNAVPVQSSVMIPAYSIDPSYRYALELLKAGIPVVYERVNTTTDTVSDSLTFEEYRDYVQGEGIPTSETLPLMVEDSPMLGSYYFDTLNKTVYVLTSYYKESEEDVYSYEWEFLEDISYIAGEMSTSQLTDENIRAYLMNGLSLDTMYNHLKKRFVDEVPDDLLDRNTYDIKYITSGGYPVFEYATLKKTTRVIAGSEEVDEATEEPSTTPLYETAWSLHYNSIAEGMINIAESRGDCIALIDHTNNKYRKLVGDTSVLSSVNGTNDFTGLDSSYAAMYSPWVNFLGKDKFAMPGSFAYLITLADSVSKNSNWMSVAGIARGVVPGVTSVNTVYKFTEAVIDQYTVDPGVSINPITHIRPVGLTIWGNRTLKSNGAALKAISFMNLRSLACELKKSSYEAAKALMFEQNSDILWINFKAEIEPLLNEMIATGGISDYEINHIATNDRTKVKALITIYPIYAVESFDISVVLTDNDTSIEESDDTEQE